MSRRIQILPDAVANQIAAGEVVERPASVVKELVENALDALCTRVDVALERGGKRRIRVSDDGVGMGREDALLCLDRHATSKIREAGDLRGVRTLGFRGEALPSIAAVSRLTLESCNGDETVGTRITVNGGRLGGVEDFPRRRGTTVDVRNLFFNAPARAKFLKSVSGETRAVSETLTTLALAYPRVGFSLTSDGRDLLSAPPASDVAGRVAQLWPGTEAGTLIGIEPAEGPGVSVQGLVQRPDAARPGMRRVHLFVNGRPFKAASVVRAAERGYRTTIPHGARPWMFLYLHVPVGDVDVNVHPAKIEVRFRDAQHVEGLVEEAVRRALDEEESAATFHVATVPQVRERPEAEDSSGGHTQMALFASGDAPARVEDGPPPVALAVSAPRLWQVLNTYIFAETRDGLIIIDQHSAHERILFQRLMDAFETGGLESQRLLFPLTLRLPRAELDQVTELGSLFTRSGFEFEAAQPPPLLRRGASVPGDGGGADPRVRAGPVGAESARAYRHDLRLQGRHQGGSAAVGPGDGGPLRSAVRDGAASPRRARAADHHPATRHGAGA